MSFLFCLLRTFTNSKTCSLRAVFYSSQPQNADKQKLGKVVNIAIIGSPNSGKSTLINKLTERKVCAASNKVHTTTTLVRAMCYQNDTQIIFLDTPGVVTEKEQRKYNLPESMVNAYHKSLRCADVVGVVHDVSNIYTKDYLHPDLVKMLVAVEDVPSFLILNKVDMLKNKKQLLTIISNLTNGHIAGNPIPRTEKISKKKEQRGYSKFSDVFLVSALNGDGIQDIKEYLISNAKPANFQYPPNEWTDQKPERIVVEAVRAKFLDFLSQEIPYKLSTQLEYFEEVEEENKILCLVSVECPSERIARLIAGAGGGRLQQIKSHARNDLMDVFKKVVHLDLNLKTKMKAKQ